MTYLIVLCLYIAALFVLAWLSRRRLGVPTLALAAGALLATLWTDSLTPIVAEAGLIIVRPPLTSVVAVVLTLLPAILVMLRMPKAAAHHHSIIGSIAFAVLGAALTYGAFSNAVVLDEASRQYVLQFVQYQNIIVTVCVALALLEILFHKKQHDKHKK